MSADNRFVERALVAGAKTCFVHFSSRNKPEGKFDRYPTGPGVSNIYLNASDNDWYLGGIPGVGTVEQSVEFIRAEAASVEAEQIVCIGSSMGAWGAALFACHLQSDLICFGPELSLKIYGGFSRENLGAEASEFLPDLPRPRRTLIAAGIACPTDLVCASYFRRVWPNVRLLVLRECGHESARRLKDAGMLESVIVNFAKNEEIVELSSSTLDPEVLDSWAPVPPHELDEASLNDFMDRLFSSLSANECIRMAHHLERRKTFGPALKLIARTREAIGEIPQLALWEAGALRKLRRHAETLKVLTTIEFDPLFRQQVLWLKGQTLEKMGQRQEAERVYRLILKEHQKNPIAEACRKQVQTFDQENQHA